MGKQLEGTMCPERDRVVVARVEARAFGIDAQVVRSGECDERTALVLRDECARFGFRERAHGSAGRCVKQLHFLRVNSNSY